MPLGVYMGAPPWTSGELPHFQCAFAQEPPCGGQPGDMGGEPYGSAGGAATARDYSGAAVSICDPDALSQRTGKRDFGAVHDNRTLEEVAALLTSGSLEPFTVEARLLFEAARVLGPKHSSSPEAAAAWEAYRELKKTAWGATYAGTFARRSKVGLLTHSGLCLLEVDGVSPGGVMPAVQAMPEVRMAYPSASGHGVHLIFSVSPAPKNNDEHHLAWAACAALMEEMGIRAGNDEGCKDVTRLAFLPHAPDRWYRPSGPDVQWDRPNPSKKRSGKRPSSVRAGERGRKGGSALAIDRDALKFVPAPPAPTPGVSNGQYNERLGWCALLKSLGFTMAEVADWGGPGYEEWLGERWTSLPPDDPADARKKLRSKAYASGWRHHSLHVEQDGPRFEDPEDAQPHARVRNDAPVGSECLQNLSGGPGSDFQLGYWILKDPLKDTFWYDPSAMGTGWWQYDGQAWRQRGGDPPRELTGEVAAQRGKWAAVLEGSGAPDLAKVLSTHRLWKEAKRGVSDTWDGARLAARASGEPLPSLHHIATPSGVLDLRTGLLMPHSPAFLCRAVTFGSFLPGYFDDARKLLREVFQKVYDDETFDDYLRLAALSLTRLPQTYRSLVLGRGGSGSGKGGACGALMTALGEYGVGVDKTWLREKISEIDSVSALILQCQARVITVHELGLGKPPDEGKLLTLTGDDPLMGRAPHCALITGKTQGAVWTTSVDVPGCFSAGSGIKRRLAVLHTSGEFTEDDKEPGFEYRKDIADAMVTVIGTLAREVYEPGYHAPVGPAEVHARTLVQMDKVLSWLEELGDVLDGTSMTELLDRARDDLAMPTLSSTILGIKVNLSKKWTKRRSSTKNSDSHQPMILTLNRDGAAQ